MVYLCVENIKIIIVSSENVCGGWGYVCALPVKLDYVYLQDNKQYSGTCVNAKHLTWKCLSYPSLV